MEYLKKGIKTVILTARAKRRPINDFLKQMGIKIAVEIIALDGSLSSKKQEYVENLIGQGYDDIFFVDDLKENVQSILELKSRYPQVKIEAEHFQL